MIKISINHVKGIYEYNNNNFYSKVSIHFQITLSINEMIERDLKFGVNNYDICFLGNINNIKVYHKSNKKCLSRRKKISL